MAKPSAAEDLGKLLLRIVLGVLILLHGVSKVIHGPAVVSGLVAHAGWPHGVTYLVYVGEVLAPVLLILGIWTRLAAMVIAINMAVAIILAHATQILALSKTGGWAIELEGIYLFTAFALALLGGGRYAIAASSPWN